MNSCDAKLFTREGLLRHRREVLGFSPRRLALLAGVFILGLAVTLWGRSRVAEIEDQSRVLAIAAGLLVALPIGVIALGFLAVRHGKRTILRCPLCAKEVLLDVTLATHRCGWCGEQIVSDALPESEASEPDYALTTRAEFAQNLKLVWSEVNRFGLVLVVVFFGGLLGFMPVASWMDKRELPAWAHTSVGSLFFLFFAIVIAAGVWQSRRAARRHRLHCPSCRESLLLQRRANLAVATGRCPCCGAAVLCDSDGNSSAAPDIKLHFAKLPLESETARS